MDLQDESVLDAHGGHLDQHLPPEELGLILAVGSGHHLGEEVLGVPRRQVRRAGGRVPVVGRRRTRGDEVRPALPDGVEVALPRRNVASGELAQRDQVRSEIWPVRIHDVVGPKRRDHPAGPSRPRESGVRRQRVERAVRRRQELDPEALEESSGAELVASEARGQVAVDVVSRRRSEIVVHAEDGGEGVVEPELRRRPREQVVVLGQLPPDLLPVRSGRRAVQGADAECLEGDALAVHETEEVVVSRDQLQRRVGIPGVLGQLRWAAVPVRAHDRQRFGRLVEASCHRPGSGIGGEEAVGMKHDCKALQRPVGRARLPRRGQESSHV